MGCADLGPVKSRTAMPPCPIRGRERDSRARRRGQVAPTSSGSSRSAAMRIPHPRPARPGPCWLAPRLAHSGRPKGSRARRSAAEPSPSTLGADLDAGRNGAGCRSGASGTGRLAGGLAVDQMDIAQSTTLGVAILLGNGDGSFNEPGMYFMPGAAADQILGVAVADFNGDGRPDVVAAMESSNSVTVLLNTSNQRNHSLTVAAR